MKRVVLFSLLPVAGLLISASALADSIRIGEVVHENVHVTESPSLYYVKLPASGRVLTVQKEDAAEVSILEDAAERERLEQQWRESRQARNSSVEYKPEDYLKKEDAAPARPLVFPESSSPVGNLQDELERDQRRGIRERVVELEADGSKAIRLKGSDVANPQVQQAQVQMLAERDAAEQRAREEELARQEELALLQAEQQEAMQQQYWQAMQQQQGQNGPYQVGGFTVVPSNQVPVAVPYYRGYGSGWPYVYQTPWHRVRPDRPGRPDQPDRPDRPRPGQGGDAPGEGGAESTPAEAAPPAENNFPTLPAPFKAGQVPAGASPFGSGKSPASTPAPLGAGQQSSGSVPLGRQATPPTAFSTSQAPAAGTAPVAPPGTLPQ